MRNWIGLSVFLVSMTNLGLASDGDKCPARFEASPFASAAELEAEILGSPVPVVVLCDADWDQHGLGLRRTLRDFGVRFSGRLKVIFLDGSHPEFWQKYGLKMVPIVLHFSAGKLQSIQRGAAPAAASLWELEQRLTVPTTE